jgi:DNA adenine methylase
MRVDGRSYRRLPLLMKPFVKWAGGKRQLLPELLKHVPSSFKTYYEPFVGGGALFWELMNMTAVAAPFPAALGDSNERLIRAYRGVRDHVEAVIEILKDFRNDEKTFYEIRATEDIDECADWTVAAWSIYLNKTCYNGLYRVNKKGRFNAPFGRYANPNICDEGGLRECSRGLQNVLLNVGDFERAVRDAGPGDFVYFDPPYVPVSKTSFTAYGKDGFGIEDHRRLAGCALELKRRGVHVLLSNSSAPIVRELYEGFEIIEVEARRSVNSKASGRSAVKEVIIK